MLFAFALLSPGARDTRSSQGRRRPLLLAVLSLLLLLSAGAASAQLGGIPGTHPRDSNSVGGLWGVDNENLKGVEPAQVKAEYRRGLRYLKEGKCRRAKQKFSFLMEVLPENASIQYLAGSADRCEKKFDSAAKHYAKAIELDEAMFSAYKSLGVSRLALGDLQSALIPLAQLEVQRIECGSDCPPELETAYLDLKRLIEMTQARGAK
ncbi:MAG: tetratricopeptide repeat protein [Myxococcota bacterium]